MKTHSFPYIAMVLGLILVTAVFLGSQPESNGSTAIPLLTLLLMSEFGFLATAIGSYIGFRHIRTDGLKLMYTCATAACAVFSLALLLFGISLWPN